jgi:hypothetical protein
MVLVQPRSATPPTALSPSSDGDVQQQPHALPGQIDSPTHAASATMASADGDAATASSATAASAALFRASLPPMRPHAPLTPLPASSKPAQLPLTPLYVSNSSSAATAAVLLRGGPGAPTEGDAAVRPMSTASLEKEAEAFLADPRATAPKLFHAPQQPHSQGSH